MNIILQNSEKTVKAAKWNVKCHLLHCKTRLFGI